MRYAKIRQMDISNGPGLGVSLFTQGCFFHCKGCHNPELFNPYKGKEWTTEQRDAIVSLCRQDHIRRFSILGGEPLLLFNIEALDDLIIKLKKVKPSLSIWVYTGFMMEELVAEPEEEVRSFLQKVDYVVDGRFEEDKKDLTLSFRGSSNQKIWVNVGRETYFKFRDVSEKFDRFNQNDIV